MDPRNNLDIAQHPQLLSFDPKNGKTLTAPPAEVAADDDELNLGQLLAILRRRWLILLQVATATTLLASASTLLQPPRYSGNINLLVEPVTQGRRLANTLTSSQEGQQFDSSIYGIPYDPGYVSQIAVLKSQALLDPIVKKIQARYPDISYGSLVSQIQIKNPEDSKILSISYSGEDPDQIQFVLSQIANGFLTYSTEDRQKNLRKAVDFVNEQITRQQQNVKTLEAELETFRQTNNLVQPTQKSDSLSQQLASLSDEQRSNQVKLAAAQTLYNSLQQQIKLDPSQGIMAANLSESPRYQDLLAQLQEVETKLAQESARLRSNTPVIQLLQDQRDRLLPLLQAEAQRIVRSDSTASQSREQLGYQGTVSRGLITNLIDAVNQVKVLQTQQQAIEREISSLNNQIKGLATVSRQYGELDRNLSIASDSLARLQIARENLQLEVARQLAPWELMTRIDENIVSDVSGTSRKLLLGGIAGLLLGIGAALLAEKLDRVFHTPGDFKETNLPCLGMIPYQKQLRQSSLLITGGAPAVEPAQHRERRYANTVPFLEAFYSLDANIRLLNSDSPIRSLTITSASPADGKSTVSTHLALAAAAMGRKVLIVDADLRLPQVHNRFNLPNLRGLSNLLTSELDAQEVIQPSLVDDNLYILTAGQLPPAPGRLLSSNKMRNYAERFAKQFDLVIYDSPPLLGFADAKLVGAHTDGILLVVGLGKTNRDNVMHLLRDLHSTTQVSVLGIVANGLKQQYENILRYDHYQKYYGRYYEVDHQTSLE
jgi:polysaccharide biosynthesis transport protein